MKNELLDNISNSLVNKLRPDKPYALLRNESKLPEIRQEAKPTASRETVEKLDSDCRIALMKLGGDDGRQVTLPQIKNYLGASLRLMEVSGSSHENVKVAQLAQDLTTADGKRAALALLQSVLNFYNQDISRILRPDIPNDHPNAALLYVNAARERQSRVTALRASMDLLLPRKAGS